ncbi:MAG: DUF1822 family protein [Jaaginema sp. PMC 1079.18]|nr:DUF1822 family protein [Jaaginema sp. PMC 1080.18]MEC4851953.1 DUF1822 family protein [Jaaginema sp. PMC 1079.18]MEC4866917.1 DUF1822 family protein [Jaaginema sp. PMC 1078.18]
MQSPHSSSKIHLTHWFDNPANSEWQTVENIKDFLPPQHTLPYRRPAPLNRRKTNPVKVERGKLIHLEHQGNPVALLVGLLPNNKPSLDISVELLPGNQHSLPSDLQLMILDEGDRAVMQAIAGGSEGLEFQFTGEPGEQFSVKVALGEFSIIEQFVI